MEQFEITYHLMPDSANVKIVVSAKTEEEAILFAKQYRRDGFSIERKERGNEEDNRL